MLSFCSGSAQRGGRSLEASRQPQSRQEDRRVRRHHALGDPEGTLHPICDDCVNRARSPRRRAAAERAARGIPTPEPVLVAYAVALLVLLTSVTALTAAGRA